MKKSVSKVKRSGSQRTKYLSSNVKQTKKGPSNNDLKSAVTSLGSDSGVNDIRDNKGSSRNINSSKKKKRQMKKSVTSVNPQIEIFIDSSYKRDNSREQASQSSTGLQIQRGPSQMTQQSSREFKYVPPQVLKQTSSALSPKTAHEQKLAGVVRNPDGSIRIHNNSFYEKKKTSSDLLEPPLRRLTDLMSPKYQEMNLPSQIQKSHTGVRNQNHSPASSKRTSSRGTIRRITQNRIEGVQNATQQGFERKYSEVNIAPFDSEDEKSFGETQMFQTPKTKLSGKRPMSALPYGKSTNPVSLKQSRKLSNAKNELASQDKANSSRNFVDRQSTQKVLSESREFLGSDARLTTNMPQAGAESTSSLLNSVQVRPSQFTFPSLNLTGQIKDLNQHQTMRKSVLIKKSQTPNEITNQPSKDSFFAKKKSKDQKNKNDVEKEFRQYWNDFVSDQKTKQQHKPKTPQKPIEESQIKDEGPIDKDKLFTTEDFAQLLGQSVNKRRVVECEGFKFLIDIQRLNEMLSESLKPWAVDQETQTMSSHQQQEPQSLADKRTFEKNKAEQASQTEEKFVGAESQLPEYPLMKKSTNVVNTSQLKIKVRPRIRVEPPPDSPERNKNYTGKIGEQISKDPKELNYTQQAQNAAGLKTQGKWFVGGNLSWLSSGTGTQQSVQSPSFQSDTQSPTFPHNNSSPTFAQTGQSPKLPLSPQTSQQPNKTPQPILPPNSQFTQHLPQKNNQDTVSKNTKLGPNKTPEIVQNTEQLKKLDLNAYLDELSIGSKIPIPGEYDRKRQADRKQARKALFERQDIVIKDMQEQSQKMLGAIPSSLIKSQTVQQRGEQTVKQIIAQQNQKKIEAHTNVVMKQGIHVAFLFASPLILKDRTTLKPVIFSKNINMTELRNAWVKYYSKEYQYEQNMAEKRADIKMKELEVTENELEDESIVYGQAWSAIRVNAMETKFEPPQSSQQQQDHELLEKLIKAQKEQGDLLPLRTKQDELLKRDKKLQEQVEALNDYERLKKNSNWSLGFLEQLDFINEQRNIKQAMRQSQQQFFFKSSVATRDNFSSILSENPKILHISCHGLKLELKHSFLDKDQILMENCLVFEKQNGEGDLIDAKTLNKLIWEKTPNLDVIFLAACNSEFAGKIFLQCQAQHVICIQKGEKVLDDAAVMFTQTFYKLLFNGKNVCEAFKQAKGDVESSFGKKEAKIFHIFVQKRKSNFHDFDFGDIDSKNTKNQHFCLPNLFKDVEKGQTQCKSQHVLIKRIPAKVKALRFREREIIKLIEDIVDKNSGEQIITLLGLHGIGKSSIAKNALNYIYERKLVQGGILWIQLKGVFDVYSAVKLIQSHIYDSLNLAGKDKLEQIKLTCTYSELVDFIAKFFQDPLLNFKGKLRKESKQDSSKRPQFVICFDNTEELITKCQQQFQELLRILTENCPNLKIVITSNKPLDFNLKLINVIPQFIPGLTTLQAAELFLQTLYKNKYELKPEDIRQLILKEQKYPIEFMFDDLKRSSLDEENKDEFNLRISPDRRKIEALSYHDLFRQLSGNPTSIVFFASAVANRYKPSHTLAKIYERTIQEGQDVQSVVSGIKSGNSERGDRQGYNSEIHKKNNYSLEFTIRTSINLIEDSDPQSHKLFYFLGCLPGGLTLQQLRFLWKQPEAALKKLEQLAFLEIGVEKKVLTPKLQEFVDQDINVASKAKHMEIISNFYLDVLKEFYQVNSGIVNKNDSPSVEVEVEKKPIGTLQQTLIQILDCNENNRRLNTVFEKVLNELRNIEYCLNYFIQKSEQRRPSAIDFDTNLSHCSSINKNLSTKRSMPNIDIELDGKDQREETKLPEQKRTTSALHLYSKKKVSQNQDTDSSNDSSQYRSLMSLQSIPQPSKPNIPEISKFDDDQVSIEKVAGAGVGKKISEKTSQSKDFNEGIYSMKSLNLRYGAQQIEQDDSSSDLDRQLLDNQSYLDKLESESGQNTPVSSSNQLNDFTPKSSMKKESDVSGNMRRQSFVNCMNQNRVPPEELIVPQSIAVSTYSRRAKYVDKKISGSGISGKQSISSIRNTGQQEREISQYNEFTLSMKNCKAIDITDSVSVSNVKKLNHEKTQEHQEISTAGQFILLFTANIFLSGDFEYCLKITAKDFTSIEKSSLFQANILRFRSLAADHVHNHKANDKNLSQQQASLQSFFLAFTTAEDALKIYEKEKNDGTGQSSKKRNHYGQALQEFQLGYLYDRSVETLIRAQTQDYINGEKEIDLQKYLFKDKSKVIERAIEHYMNAHKHFAKVKHLFGSYQAKKHESMLREDHTVLLSQGNQEKKEKLESIKVQVRLEADKEEKRFREYITANTQGKCPYIERVHGEEISLLTEIVYSNHSRQVFQ